MNKQLAVAGGVSYSKEKQSNHKRVAPVRDIIQFSIWVANDKL